MTTPPLDLTQNDLDIIRLIADGGNRNDVMTIKNTAVLRLLDRLEAAERDLAAVTVSRDGWQTRAKAAEKAVAAVRGLTDHYAALADSMPKPHGIVTRTQAIFVRDLRQALDAHTPETETTP